MPLPRVRLVLLGLIPVAVLALILAAALARPSDDPGSAIEVSGAMPALQGEWLNGGPLEPADFRGRVVVVNFWADWCGPCRKEQPVLQRLSEVYAGRAQFVGVNYRDDQAKALEYIREFGVTYPSVVDDGPLGHAFGVPYLPATILVDAEGEMRWLLLGAQTEADLRERIDELLAA